VAPLQLAADDVLLLFDGGVVETFQTGYDRSFRTPAAWLVELDAADEPRMRGFFTRVADAADRRPPVAVSAP
jgi:hypothetical protein